jgi:hypothetical protein
MDHRAFDEERGNRQAQERMMVQSQMIAMARMRFGKARRQGVGTE